MLILHDITGTTYQQLLRYAIDHSDAVMFVWNKEIEPTTIKTVADYRREALESPIPFKITPEIIGRWEKMERNDRAAVQSVQESRVPFIESLSPFMLKLRRGTEWPSTKILMCNNKFHIATYRSCKELYPLLVQPNGFFSWRYPKYPEDLSFFKDNRCWLYASSHEEYIGFLPRTYEEYEFIASLGISMDAPYTPIEEKDRFWEEYCL